VRPLEIVEVFRLLELAVEDLGVVDDLACEHPIELHVVDAIRTLDLAAETWGQGSDLDRPFPPQVVFDPWRIGTDLSVAWSMSAETI
jgi:hypothetical protein